LARLYLLHDAGSRSLLNINLIRDAFVMPPDGSSIVLARRPRVRTGCTTCKYVANG
jgi:hypothetical protein